MTLLPQMLAAVEVPVDRLEVAAPILTGFLGGYVVAMPLLGAFSDARGRLPAYSVALISFGLGSVVTATAPALGWLVAGRVLQGLGGGALVPLSLALAADFYSAARRARALGAVAALQEAGSVIGPIYGAWLAAALGGWRAVFWLNLPLGGIVLGGLWWTRTRRDASRSAAGSGLRQVDWASAALLGLGLGLLVAALYPDDPQHRPLNTLALPLGAVGLAGLAAFGWRQARRLSPLIAPDLLRSPILAGSLAANILAGAALMVALVDVPIVARGVFQLNTLDSGLLLSRLLLGVPLGALAGGWLVARLGPRWPAAAGLLLAAAAFTLMSGWRVDELRSAAPSSSAELFFCGLGFGLVIAPLSVAVLDASDARSRGVASSLVVLARTMGMVVGLAALTAFGLSRFQRIFVDHRCDVPASGGSLRQQLTSFENCVRGALLQEYREIFLVAAALCLMAAVVAVLTLEASRGLRSPPGSRAAAQG